MRPCRLIGFSLFGFGLLACGSGNGGGTGGLPGGAGTSGPVSFEDFPKKYADAICKVAASCCATAGIAYDDAHCRDDHAVDPGKFAYLNNGQTLRFDADGAGRCLDAIANAGCGVDDDLDQPGCEGTIVGLVPQGGKCFESIECAPVLGKRIRCETNGEDTEGVCREFVTSPADGPCGRDVFGECGEGLVCEDATQPTSTCVAAPRAGEKCGIGGPCEPGYHCSTSSFTCEAIVANGGACKSFTDCVEGSQCKDGVCRTRGADGAACGNSEDCASNRCVNDRCRQKIIQSCGEDSGSAPGSATPAPND